jgi:hypothetical protein
MKRAVLALAAACCVAALSAPAAFAKPRPTDPADHGAALQYLAAAVAFNKQTYAHDQEASKELNAQYGACASEFANVAPARQIQIGLIRAIAQGVRGLELSASDYAAYAQTLHGIPVKSAKLRSFTAAVAAIAAETAKVSAPLDVCQILHTWRDAGYSADGELSWFGDLLESAGIDAKAFTKAALNVLSSAASLTATGLTRHEAGFVVDVSAYGLTLGLGSGFAAAFGS